MRDAGGWSLLVHGKGQRERVVPLLDEIAQAIREAPRGWVFPNGEGTHITPAHLSKIMGWLLVWPDNPPVAAPVRVDRVCRYP
jgi:integrase